jgi:hypothetical protein
MPIATKIQSVRKRSRNPRRFGVGHLIEVGSVLDERKSARSESGSGKPFLIRIDNNPDHNTSADSDGNACTDVVKDNTKYRSDVDAHCQADPNEPVIVLFLGRVVMHLLPHITFGVS